MSKYRWAVLCKVFGHRYTVVWNMQSLVGVFCNRCGSWRKEATDSPKPVKANERTTDLAEASSEPEGKPNE
jgi:hypothetical protein